MLPCWTLSVYFMHSEGQKSPTMTANAGMLETVAKQVDKKKKNKDQLWSNHNLQSLTTPPSHIQRVIKVQTRPFNQLTETQSQSFKKHSRPTWCCSTGFGTLTALQKHAAKMPKIWWRLGVSMKPFYWGGFLSFKQRGNCSGMSSVGAPGKKWSTRRKMPVLRHPNYSYSVITQAEKCPFGFDALSNFQILFYSRWFYPTRLDFYSCTILCF